MILTAVRNATEGCDKHLCFKNRNPARACLRRREGPCQSGGALRIVIKNKRRDCKPGSVPSGRTRTASIIYLSSLPPGKGRAALDCRYIWPCRPQADTPMMSPSNGRRLLPCIFTLTSPEGGAVVFCSIRYAPFLRLPRLPHTAAPPLRDR